LPRGHYGWVDHADDLDPDGFMDRRDLLPYHRAFRDLIDRPEIFDLIVDIMGPYILFSMSQAIVRASTDQFPGYTHTDGGEGLRRIRVTETSRPIAVKAMYLLSDVEGSDSGNFTVFPGSHLRPFPENNAELTPHTPGAVQLDGKAGDCYIFSHALWHGPAPNGSGKGRKTLLYNYCQMFVRSYDLGQVPDVVKECTPRQRRLLGDLGYDFRPGSYFYVPEDQEEVITGTAP
jgi:ectoine hydroxylase-related dioxygenase (phytanoyl-CoA dioxygenase family)